MFKFLILENKNDSKTNINNLKNKTIPSENNFLQNGKTIKKNDKKIISYRIDEKHPIEYYLHYFAKNRYVVFPETQNEYPYLVTQCTDRNCYKCDPIFPDNCKKCATGFFLYNNGCNMECPMGFIADTILEKCLPKNLNPNSFTMAYSIGSCVNKCGKKSYDCSCSQDCKKFGHCCSDYNIHDCDHILDVSKIVEKKCKDCQLCVEELDENKNPTCVQCPDDKYFYSGKCYSDCPEDTFRNEKNLTYCSVDNCESCFEGNILKCKQCMNGSYLFDGRCVKTCPSGYRADKILWNCNEFPMFAWYWVHPSKNTCKDNCGNSLGKSKDCSCNDICFREGNCCSDIETFCTRNNFDNNFNI